MNFSHALIVAALQIFPLLTESYSQSYQFGKNKVQYDEFEWQKPQTRHFDDYFYNGEEE